MTRDTLLRATGAHGSVAVLVVDSTNTIRKMEETHETSAVVSAALGRLTTGGLLMGAQMKNDKDNLTLQIQSDGPIENMVVVVNSFGEVKSFARHTQVELPPKNEKLDVGGAVGAGELTVMKDMGLKEPYIGTIALQTGEIAEDLTAYFALSEQIPTAIALGVLVEPDLSVSHAGGFMIQLLPNVTDDIIEKLEAHLLIMEPVTAMLAGQMTAADILEKIMEPFGIDEEITASFVSYTCDCSRERMEKALISVGKAEIINMIETTGQAELSCQFCNTSHLFTRKDLESLIASGNLGGS